MSKKRDTDTAYKPSLGIKPPQDKDYQLGSVQRSIVVEDTDSGRGSEALGVVAETVTRDPGVNLGLDIDETEGHLEQERGVVVRERKPRMSRETSQASSLDMFATIIAEIREAYKKREDEAREAERRQEEDRERREVEREKREEERERRWRDENDN